MTGFEIVTIVIAIISLLISAITLFLKLFAYLDDRHHIGEHFKEFLSLQC